MRLDYHVPAADLRDCISVHACCAQIGVHVVETLPAMLPNLHITLAGRLEYGLADGRRVLAPPVSLLGPTSRAYQLVLSPDLDLLTIGLMPEGWMRLVGEDAAACVDLAVDCEALWGGAAVRRLGARLAGLQADGDRIACVEAFLRSIMRARTHAGLEAVRTVVHWTEHDRTLSLQSLSEALGVCDRQARRVVLGSHGVSPKTLAMKYRALRTRWRCAGRPRCRRHCMDFRTRPTWGGTSGASSAFRRLPSRASAAASPRRPSPGGRGQGRPAPWPCSAEWPTSDLYKTGGRVGATLPRLHHRKSRGRG